MKAQIVRNQLFDVVQPFRSSRIYPEELFSDNSKWVVTFRASMAGDFEGSDQVDGGRFIYSMWPGYLERGSPNLRDWCADNGAAFDILHTSGHASRDDLARVVEALKPKAILPIHTLAPERYADLGAPVSTSANSGWHVIR